jgi:hypothetical protein
MSDPTFERDEDRFCLVCCRHSDPNDGPLVVTSQGPTCEDCIDFVRENDALDSAIVRERARKGACVACGSLLRNNTKCAACRQHLLDNGLTGLLRATLRFV